MNRAAERAHATATVALALALITTLLGRPEPTPAQPIATPQPSATLPPTPSAPAWTLEGIATWYDATRNGAWFTQKPRPGAAKRNQDGAPYAFYAAASPALRSLAPFRWGAEPYAVRITNTRNGRAIIAWVVDECGCKGRAADPSDDRAIDLAPAAFLALGVPLGHGIQTVTIEPVP